MAPLRSSLDIASPPDVVWDLISSFEHWPSWGVTITAVEPSAGRVRTGSTGRVKTVAGLWVPFEITDVLESGCRVTFTAPVWAPFYLPVLTRALHLIGQESTAP